MLENLTADDIGNIGAGRHQMDAHVRKYVHSYLGYRFVIFPDGATALKIEKLIKYGEWSYGKPLLNPAGRAAHPKVHSQRSSAGSVPEDRH